MSILVVTNNANHKKYTNLAHTNPLHSSAKSQTDALHGACSVARSMHNITHLCQTESRHWQSPCCGSACSCSPKAMSSAPGWLNPVPDSQANWGTAHSFSQQEELLSWLTPNVAAETSIGIPSQRHLNANKRKGTFRPCPEIEPQAQDQPWTHPLPDVAYQDAPWTHPLPEMACAVRTHKKQKVAHHDAETESRVSDWSPQWLNPSAEAESSKSQSTHYSEPGAAQKSEVDLTMGMVILANHICNKPDAETDHFSNTEEVKHVQHLVKMGCKGRGKSGHCSICQSTPSWQDLVQFRALYQSLPPDEAANLLNTCCSTGIALGNKKRITWKLMGHRVCTHRLMKLLGTSSRTFYDNCKGELDMRCFNGRLPTSACLSVDRFLLEHWHYNSLN